MRDYPEYERRDAGELADLYDSQPTCLLVTRAGSCGVFNHVRLDRKFYLHLSRPDEQLAELRNDPRAKLVFQDILAIIPSYWVEESYGGVRLRVAAKLEERAQGSDVRAASEIRKWISG